MTWADLRSKAENEKISLVGYQIKINDTWYLIGDTNDMGGACDCCSQIIDTDVISEIDTPENGIIRLQK